MQPINEPDWKVFRQLQPIALERFCQRVLDEVVKTASRTDKTSHERYLSIYRLMQRRDRELGDAFNDFRRSTAVLKLLCIQSHDLLTEEELSRFSATTLATLALLRRE